MNLSGKKQSKRTKKSAADYKVVYISSPMKVKTSASKFRSLVQKLTGQDSDAERFMELIAAAAATAAADRKNLQSSASAFLDYQILGEDDYLIERDHCLAAGKIETAAYESSVDLTEDLVLQNFDVSFGELFDGFLHESSAQTEMPGAGLSPLL